MKALAAAALLALVVACGQGRAIFNVDVLSFMQPSGRDTIPYNLPPSVITITADSFIPVQKISLPSGLGNSSVDSVSVTAAAVVSLVLNLGVNLALIPTWGILGAAAASLVSYTAYAILMVRFASQVSGSPWHAFVLPRAEDVARLGATLGRLNPMTSRSPSDPGSAT